eukprot:129938-Chlamydomonas_euryale.AAC.1
MELRKGTLPDKALPGVFIGMQPGWAAWRILMGDGQVKVSRDVCFNESVFLCCQLQWELRMPRRSTRTSSFGTSSRQLSKQLLSSWGAVPCRLHRLP